SRTAGGVRAGPPAIGEHTDQVLEEVLGLTTEEIARLREGDIVAGPLPSPVPLILQNPDVS
ncbi:MAG TPA: hypothetical protein VNL15_08975, partial [Dehalococcoidia bacterium]|nr:hypothetical protein [Dehalococcoidia bacterium]